MPFYGDKILPRLVDRLCSMPNVMSVREAVVPKARGVVLEVGMGSGINLSLYDADKVDFVWGLEPSSAMRLQAQKNIVSSAVNVKWLDLPGEKIPLENESVDTILLTFTLCTIPDCQAALQHMYRVLKPNGQLLFCEHGLSHERSVQRLQNAITPIWKPLAGGCHLNRPIADCLKQGGFKIKELDNIYLKQAPRFVAYMYYGVAVK